MKYPIGIQNCGDIRRIFTSVKPSASDEDKNNKNTKIDFALIYNSAVNIGEKTSVRSHCFSAERSGALFLLFSGCNPIGGDVVPGGFIWLLANKEKHTATASKTKSQPEKRVFKVFVNKQCPNVEGFC